MENFRSIYLEKTSTLHFDILREAFWQFEKHFTFIYKLLFLVVIFACTVNIVQRTIEQLS